MVAVMLPNSKCLQYYRGWGGVGVGVGGGGGGGGWGWGGRGGEHSGIFIWSFTLLSTLYRSYHNG